MPGGGRLNILVLFAVGMDEREGRINMASDLQAAGLLQLAFHADEISRPVHEWIRALRLWRNSHQHIIGAAQ